MTEPQNSAERYGQRTSGTAVVSLTAALFALVLWPLSALFAGVAGIVGASTALIARSQLKRTNAERGYGLSLAGFIVGIVVAMGALGPLLYVPVLLALDGI